MLGRLLESLAAQHTCGEFEFSIVVVDNDHAGSARDTVGQLRARCQLDVTYEVGALNSIPAARNHALRLAKGNYIGIIDDDEFPLPQWLITLYHAIKTFNVDGALGPVVPYFETRPPAWLLRGRFCERPLHRTGTLLHWQQTRTGNVLIKRDVFDKNLLLFDESFTTGGSDREFFKQAMSRGCRFIAVEEAPVFEIVPPERQTKGYWLRRAVVNGFNAHKNSIGQVTGLPRLLLAPRLSGAVLLYSMAAPVCALLGTHVLIHCLERGAHHLSRLCAMMGTELIKERNF
jgi:succinoglycan biosynthesis protein ExoM